MKWTLLLIVITACTSAPSSGASCPTRNPPTYDSFGRAFMTAYCTGCHSRAATNRHGAPPGLDFDTEAQIQRHRTAIDAEAARGPDADNTDMPDLSGPVRTPPSSAERSKLGQFLACEAR